MTRPADFPPESFRALVEHVPAVLYEAEPGDGRWFYVSSQLQELIGDAPQTWIDDPGRWVSRVHPDDREAVMATERREFELAKGSAATYVSEYRMLRDDGSVVWIRDEARLADDRDPPVWRGILIDITKEREAGAALDEAHARAGELVEGPAGEAHDGLAAAQRQVKQLLDGIQQQMKVLERAREAEAGPVPPGATRRVITSLEED